MSTRTLTVFSTGNEELDGKLGGGIPHPALIVIEGDNGTAKTTLAAQIMLGALNAGLRVIMFTTEHTARQFILQTRLISIDLTKFYIKGKLVIYSLYSISGRLDKEYIKNSFKKLVEFLRKEGNRAADLIVIDSLSLFISNITIDDVINFVSTVRRVVSRGTTILITVHTEIIGEGLTKIFRASSDVYYKLGTANVGGKTVKVLQVIKARGAPEPIEGSLAFDVDPAFGIKIVPIVIAQS